MEMEKKKISPWSTIDLTKSERKGKSWKEIQELRKRKWAEKVLESERKRSVKE